MRARVVTGWSAAVLAAALSLSSLEARDGVRQVPPRQVPLPQAPEAPAAPETAAPRPAAERGQLSVAVDRAKVIRLPERTQTVVVGNPAIADLAIQKSGVVVVTGKSYGVTNLIALDQTGNLLAESTVSVTAPSDGIMVVQRGFDRQSYSCTPNCQPSVVLGDSQSYFAENRGQADARNQFATSR